MNNVVQFLLLIAQQSTQSVFERLDPRLRAAVVMALLGLTLTGLFLILFIMIGGHWVRRLARHRPGRGRAEDSTVDIRQLREALQTILPDGKTSDTVLLDTTSKDTKIES